MLFDLGRIDRQPAATLLKITHVFVSHTHMDHFIGFDHLLRVFLARDSHIDMYGPQGMNDWPNLVRPVGLTSEELTRSKRRMVEYFLSTGKGNMG